MITYQEATANGFIDSNSISVLPGINPELVNDFFDWARQGDKPRRYFRLFRDGSRIVNREVKLAHPLLQAVAIADLERGADLVGIHAEARFKTYEPGAEDRPFKSTENYHVDNSGQIPKAIGAKVVPHVRMVADVLPPLVRVGSIPCLPNLTHRQINMVLMDRALVEAHTEAFALNPLEVVALDGLGVHANQRNLTTEPIDRSYLRVTAKWD